MRIVGLLSAVMVLATVSALLSQEPKALTLSGDYALTHDPSIARKGNTYYVFATTSNAREGQFPIRCSNDLLAWKLCGFVFDKIPAWIHDVSPNTRDLWAPDISFFHGRYHLYYAYSTFGSNTSGIALATNETLDPKSPKYHWRDEGLVLKSTHDDNFNAIDPNIVFDEKGQMWLSFGSFWGGIKMRRIDEVTGKPASSDSTIYSLAARVPPHPRNHPNPACRAIGRQLKRLLSCAVAVISIFLFLSICAAAASTATIEPWLAVLSMLPAPMWMRLERPCSMEAGRSFSGPTVAG